MYVMFAVCDVCERTGDLVLGLIHCCANFFSWSLRFAVFFPHFLLNRCSPDSVWWVRKHGDILGLGSDVRSLCRCVFPGPDVRLIFTGKGVFGRVSWELGSGILLLLEKLCRGRVSLNTYSPLTVRHSKLARKR